MLIAAILQIKLQIFFHLLLSVQSLSQVQLFVTPWTGAHQGSLSITNSRSLLKLHHICYAIQPSHPVSSPSPAFNLPSIRVFLISQIFSSGGQSIGASTSASVLPMNIQHWFPLGLIGSIFLLSKRLSRVFSKFKNTDSSAVSLL